MKRYISVILLLALAVSLFAGCQETIQIVPPYSQESTESTASTESSAATQSTEAPTESLSPSPEVVPIEALEAPGDRESYQTTDGRDGCIQLVKIRSNFVDEGVCCSVNEKGTLMIYDFDLGSKVCPCPKANCPHTDENCPLWLGTWDLTVESWYGVIGDILYFARTETNEGGYSQAVFGQVNMVTGEKTLYPVGAACTGMNLRNVFTDGKIMAFIIEDEEKSSANLIDIEKGSLTKIWDWPKAKSYSLFVNFWGLTPRGDLLYTSHSTINGDPGYDPAYDGSYSDYLERLQHCNFLYINLYTGLDKSAPVIQHSQGGNLIISSYKNNLGNDIYNVYYGQLYFYDTTQGRNQLYRGKMVLTDWAIEDFLCLDGRVFFSTKDGGYYWYDPAGIVCSYDGVHFKPQYETQSHLIGSYRGQVCAIEKQAFYQGDFSETIFLGSLSDFNISGF